jgi:hypothetical protein
VSADASGFAFVASPIGKASAEVRRYSNTVVQLPVALVLSSRTAVQLVAMEAIASAEADYPLLNVSLLGH